MLLMLHNIKKCTDKNVKYCAEIVERLGVRHVIVVTSNNHIKRSMEFAYQYMPDGVKIYAYPSGGATRKEIDVMPEMFIPSIKALRASSIGIKAWIGRAVASLGV